MPSFEELRSSATAAMNKAKESVGLTTQEADPEQPPDRLEQLADACCPQLTFQQRIIGFFTCFGIGYLITFTSFRFFIQMIEGNPVPYATVYSVGNVLALLSTTFLCGPKRQLKNMFDEKRRTTSIVYLSCLAATLVLIFIPLKDVIKLILLVLLVLAQFCACVWYTLSYIPYGRRTFLNLMKSWLGIEPGEGI